MLFYVLYLMGSLGVVLLPRSVSYWLACRLADLYSRRVPEDRRAVRCNLAAILNTEEISDDQVSEVFRNFAMYLVDFFLFRRLNRDSIRRWIQIEGLEQMQEPIRRGRGAIGLTAHLGNFEMAGAVLSLMGLPMYAIVFTHQNPRVNAFFSRQRSRVGVRGIPIHRKNQRQTFEAALRVLKGNGVLALVGDRDYFQHGLELPLFGRTMRIPRGLASFSIRTGAPIVPAFLVREPDGKYRLVLEPAIPIPQGMSKEEAVRKLTEDCLEVMARYIRKYPTQWYLFQEFWKPAHAVIL